MTKLCLILSSAIILTTLSGCATPNPYAVPKAQLESAEYKKDVADCEKLAKANIKTDVQKVVAESVASSIAVSVIATALLGGPVYSARVAEDTEAKNKRHEYVVNCLKEKGSNADSPPL